VLALGPNQLGGGGGGVKAWVLRRGASLEARDRLVADATLTSQIDGDTGDHTIAVVHRQPDI
jgi:hypothetical protein